jgi:succinyl-CoA synthetase beta subunit
MLLDEHRGKAFLAEEGIRVPEGVVVRNVKEAEEAYARLGGKVVVKAQVAGGGRGKAGAVRFAGSREEASRAAAELLGGRLGEHRVERLLVERFVEAQRELYAAVFSNPRARTPSLLFTESGGMDVEASTGEGTLRQMDIDIRRGLGWGEVEELLSGVDIGVELRRRVGSALLGIYRVYRKLRAQLVEVNPLAVGEDGEVWALDCKIWMDEAVLGSQEFAGLVERGGQGLEAKGKELGLTYVDLGGEIGIVANGAGFTMAVVDSVAALGGRPANFLEIGGANYVKGREAVGLVLENPQVKTLLVAFCGAFARTDVMVEGVLEGLREAGRNVPVVFWVAGTGAERARRLLEEKGMGPAEDLKHAIETAVKEATQVRCS